MTTAPAMPARLRHRLTLSVRRRKNVNFSSITFAESRKMDSHRPSRDTRKNENCMGMGKGAEVLSVRGQLAKQKTMLKIPPVVQYFSGRKGRTRSRKEFLLSPSREKMERRN